MATEREEKVTIGERSSFTVGMLVILLGGATTIASLLGAVLMYLDNSRGKQIDEMKTSFAELRATFSPAVEKAAEQTTRLVVEVQGAVKSIDELKVAFDGTTAKVIDLARQQGSMEATLAALKDMQLAQDRRIATLEAKQK